MTAPFKLPTLWKAQNESRQSHGARPRVGETQRRPRAYAFVDSVCQSGREVAGDFYGKVINNLGRLYSILFWRKFGGWNYHNHSRDKPFDPLGETIQINQVYFSCVGCDSSELVMGLIPSWVGLLCLGFARCRRVRVDLPRMFRLASNISADPRKSIIRYWW